MVEPSAEEVADFDGEASDGAEIPGIPEFWLTVLKNSPVLQGLITDIDEAALKHLKDIRSVHLEENPVLIIFENDLSYNLGISIGIRV